MSVRMAAPLTLVLLLMIHRVYGQSGYSVSYGSSHICALKGSTVTMSCTYRYPYGSYVMMAFWTKDLIEGEEPTDLSVDPEYSQRLQYLGDKQQNCTVRLSHVTEKDEHEYYFKFITYTDSKWVGKPGVRLSVTDLQLESPERVTEGVSVRLTCKSSCNLTDTPTFIWYRNSQPLTERDFQNDRVYSLISRGDAGYYSCGVQGHDYISPAVYLDVRYAPDTPVISVSGSAVIMEGDSVTLTCSSDSNPPAEISWYKGTQHIGFRSIFSISKISFNDSGEYKCRARNEHGDEYSDPVTLDVQFQQGSGRKRTVITVVSGVFIIMLLFVIRLKWMNRIFPVNDYEVK
ncbi:B-cell receptor CD22-like [Danio aesculapii]|uniref:B-cell receptor CD22-like n=1 Tax=Danio aesculapii TaxID=1142201 RepID=UPI0024C0DDA2|nr:B-cell receptor CD22-like [Danio aesculapii]